MKEDDCAPDRLRPRAEALLAGASAHPLMRALWQPRLMEAIDFIAGEVEKNRKAGRRPLAAEAEGGCELAGVRLKRSEERRVGKERRTRGAAGQDKQNDEEHGPV